MIGAEHVRGLASAYWREMREDLERWERRPTLRRALDAARAPGVLGRFYPTKDS